MTTPIVFPDAVATVLDHLAATLPGYGTVVETYKNIPTTRPTRFVRALRTGGPKHNLVTDAAQVTLECWADTDVAAHDLAQIVRGVVNAMPYNAGCYRVDELGGPADLPDPASNQSRCTWSILIYLRGQPIN